MKQSDSAGYIRFSRHAEIQIADRLIEAEWVSGVLLNPVFVREDGRHPGVKLAFGRVSKSGNQWLRVAYSEKPHGIIVITAFFDRNAEKWR